MTLPSAVASIDGAQQLHDWFGYWPDFHDAEVISLWLNRSSPSSLFVHTWERTNEIDQKGYYVSAKHAIVEFVLDGITDLDLSDFSKQNVVGSIDIQKTGVGFAVVLSPCYGLAGKILANSVFIRIKPGTGGAPLKRS